MDRIQTITRYFTCALAAVLLTSCASRIPVTKPPELVWWTGKQVQLEGEAFNLVPNYAGRGAAPWKDSTAFMGDNYPLRVQPGQRCTVVRFYRETEGEGSHIFAVLRTTVAGAEREFELMFLPDSRLPGKNDAERVARELSLKSPNPAWTLAE